MWAWCFPFNYSHYIGDSGADFDVASAISDSDTVWIVRPQPVLKTLSPFFVAPLGATKKRQSFLSNRQRRKDGTFCASELAGIEPTPPAPKGAGYVRLDHSATGATTVIRTKPISASCSLVPLRICAFKLLAPWRPMELGSCTSPLLSLPSMKAELRNFLGWCTLSLLP
jgi:hypothetical protein